MKHLTYSIIAVLFVTFTVQAQENKDTQKETVTKKVTFKDTNVDTKVVQQVKEDSEVLTVEGTNEVDQNSQVTSKSDNSEHVVEDTVSVDEGNTKKIQQNINRKNEELKASIAAQKAKAKKKRELLQEKKMQMQKELKKRRAMLEKRPEGMAKLKKDN